MYLLSGSSDCDVIKWDMSTCEVVHVFRGHAGLWGGEGGGMVRAVGEGGME